MDYQNYMRSVLGYGNDESNYTYENYYPRAQENEYDELDGFYPDVYRIINPTVEAICNKNRGNRITEDSLRNMVDEVYTTIENNPSLPAELTLKVELKNGDVRNPNAKETRQRNYLLNDLIRILILKNLINNRPPRPPMRPPIPGPGPRPPYRV